MRMMRPGISTACLYPMEIERSLDLLLSMDFKLYEFFLNTWSELTPSFLRLLRNRLESEGAQVKSIHPFTSAIEGMLFFSEYLRRMEDALEFYKTYFEAAGMLGAKILVLHGQKGYRTGKLRRINTSNDICGCTVSARRSALPWRRKTLTSFAVRIPVSSPA